MSKMIRLHKFGGKDVLKAEDVQVSQPDAGTEPSQQKAKEFGVRALRYTVEAGGAELAEIAALVAAAKVRPHVQRAFPLDAAADALASVEKGHSVGKIVLKVA